MSDSWSSKVYVKLMLADVSENLESFEPLFNSSE